MIRTWIADVTGLYEKEKYLQNYSSMPEERKEKADRLRKQEDKALSIGAWLLLQRMEKEYHLQGNYLYNLSHSGRYALCSVDTGRSRRLGCDLEKVQEYKKEVVGRFFCQPEKAFLESLDGERQRQAFYRYWVLKESFLKATRMGLSLGMDQFEIGFLPEDKPYIKNKPEAFPETYYFQEYAIEGVPYRIAVCADTRDFAPDIPMIIL